ncbi:ENHANCER OF AG-4 protein 2-like isoform X1 [Salvia splendens]|uniref:ENHANCER OF AG-4 protein 2-like isoform X1 n=1 Tax=Salvia splendens TaxID=180675 RepID=UPI001C268A01|nr:ENHANCER OF AG-4 protein 2-like isoform X1 [Salvia splendens]XP_042057353.1 ENHANCER OF AG-4 protein 2-like isoform X1 [Salvia splendens]XP_042057354.1 ENHANCER OF AG-4 protein 2-like isoform X1 [Salvia splendens]
MAPGRRRGAKGVKAMSELSLGDLVLAKVKGFPAWPAKISRPEDWQRASDPKKCFVQFFGTAEIAFVAPVDIQIFTNEAKNKLSARCLGKTVKYFAQAVKDICEEFEELQRKNFSGVRDDDSTQTNSPEAHSVDSVVDEVLDVNRNNGIAPECKLETKESDDPDSGLEHHLHKQDEVECLDVKPYLSNEVNCRLSPPVSLRKNNKLSSNHNNVVKDSLSVSSPSHHSLKKEDSLDSNVKGRLTDGSQNELTNGHRPKLAMGSKKKSPGAVLRSGGSAVPHDHKGEVMRRKIASGDSMKLSSPDIPKLHLEVSSQKREKRLLKEERQSEAVHGVQQDAKVNFESHGDVNPRKKMKVQHGSEKKGSHTNEISSPAKISKPADTGKDANLIKAQINGKSYSRGPNNALDDKMAGKDPKRFTSVGKAEVLPIRPPIVSNTEFDNDLPRIKRHQREPETMSGAALISENRPGTSVSHKTDLIVSNPNKVISPVVQLPLKRRSVRICGDDDDELPKTPVHGGTNKVSLTPRMSDSKRKSVTHCEKPVHESQVLRNSREVDNVLKEQVQFNRAMNKLLSPAAQQGMEKRTRESSAAHVSPSPQKLDSEKLTPMEVKLIPVSPKRSSQPVGGERVSGELESTQPNKAPSNDFRKKTPAGSEKNAASSDRSNAYPNQLLSERSKQPYSGEKKNTTLKLDSRINDSVLGTSKENIMSVQERLSVSKAHKTSHAVDSKTSDSVSSMKHLIAAAQARKKQTHFQNTYGNPFLFSIPDTEMAGRGPRPAPTALAYEASNTLQLDVLEAPPRSPCSSLHQIQSDNAHENDELEERRVSSGHQGTGSSLSGGTEASVARDAFEGMIETLSRTKESIARATRLAIDCAKYGLANEVVELLIQKLENEPSLHRRVDLFFLVDSITQCSHTQRGASYVSTVQAVLPRLIGAAAPAGAGAQENRHQCRKVLRLWLERKILPESVLRLYMDGFGVVNDDMSIPLRRPSRAERSIDDPIREMEGMVVDEYGSNALFQLPGFLSTSVFEEEEDGDASDTSLCLKDDGASPSKHTPATDRDHENHSVTPSDRRHCILEDVDGELEMEDVSGHQKDERSLMTNGSIEAASLELDLDDGGHESSSNTSTEWLPSPEGSPPLPAGSPPMTPPLPTSPPPSSPPPLPPPSSPPPPPPPPPTSHQHPFPQPPVGSTPPVGPPSRPTGPSPSIGPPLRPAGSSPPVGPPPPHIHPPPPPFGHHPPPFGPPPHLGPSAPLVSQQAFPCQPPLVSHNKTPLSPRSSYRPHPLPHEVGATSTVNQHTRIVSTTHGPHMDASIKGEVPPHQSSCFPPFGVSIAQERVVYNSSRHVKYGEDETLMNPQASQHRQQYLPGSVPFAQRPVRPELPSQRQPSHFAHPNSAQQHQYPSYSLPNVADGPRRYITDEQWRKQGNDFNMDHPRSGWMPGGRLCSGPSHSRAGYHERSPSSSINYQHSAPNSLPPSGQMPVHGAPMMASAPNIPDINWRPA